VALSVRDPEPTLRLLVDVFGYREVGEETGADRSRHRLRAAGDEPAGIVDLVRDERHAIGHMGAGAIHHVAFRARDDEEQSHWRERLASAGFEVTPVIDRQYFNAIYFREPGGVLFEIATDPPGFAVDEAVEELGTALKLPPRYEPIRERIERGLPPVRIPA
jgi:glyoxalase family protein